MISTLHRRGLFGLGGAMAFQIATSSSKAEEAPSTPSTPMPPVEVYAASPFIDQIALSPDATRCAVVTQKGDDKFVIHFNVAGKNPKSLGIGPAKVRGLFFGDNEHVIVTTSVTKDLPHFAGGKNEFAVMRSLRLVDGQVVTYFSKQQGFYGLVAGDVHRIKVDGTYKVTASNYYVSGNFNHCLFTFDMDDPKGKMVQDGSYEIERWVLGPDGHPFAYSEFTRESKVWELFYNVAGPGKSKRFKSIYSVKEPLNTPDLIGLGRDGKSVVIYLNSDDKEGEYHEISPEGVMGPPLDPEGEGRGRRALFHPVTWCLAGFSHYDDWMTYDYFDPLLKKISDAIPPTMGEDYRAAIVDFAEDPRKMIVYGESNYDAGSYYFIDFSTGETIRLASNYPDIPAEWITQKTPIRYKAADGLEIAGYLTLPPFTTAKDLPLIVLPHGGPQARDNIGFDWQVQVLASRGYAVLQPNFRGSSGYGDAFVEKGHGEWGRKMQTDLSDGVRWLASQGTIDPKRVAILGASYGGYAALAGATLDPGVYRCAVSIAGVSDLKQMIREEVRDTTSSESRTVLYWKQFMGDAKGYDDISPAKQAEHASCPILLIHGTDDTVVPIDQSQRMEKALKAAGKPVEFVTYKGQDHWETIGSHRIDMMKTALAFLQKHNPAG